MVVVDEQHPPDPPLGLDAGLSYSKISRCWIYEDEKGVEYQYDSNKATWNPVHDADEISTQQSIYSGEKGEKGEEGEEGEKGEKGEKGNKGEEGSKEGEGEKLGAKKGKDMGQRKIKKDNNSNKPEERERVNSGIYVSGLPSDVTFAELKTQFSRYGLISQDLRSGQDRIKIYTDESGAPKGDASIIYFKPESVKLAIEMMDGAELRHGQGPISVHKSQFKTRRESCPEPDKPALDKVDKVRIKRKLDKLNARLADWDDPASPEGGSIVKRTKDLRTVVLRHMFTLDELEEDPSAGADIIDDIRTECEAIGPVVSVTLYDLEPMGIVTVKFQHSDDAKKCVQAMKGRYFGGRQLEASLGDATGLRRRVEDEQAEEQRLQTFGDWLEK